MSKGLAFVKSAAVALAMVGIVLPQARVMAEQKQPVKTSVKVVPANTVFDVSLGQGGVFSGRAVDHTGIAVAGAKVVVKQGKTEVGHAVTDETGNFAVQNVKSGVYTVNSGTTEGSYRLWSEQTAPPSAKAHGLVVLGENGARGQCGSCDSIMGPGMGMILLGGAAVALGIAALIIALDAHHDAKNAFHSP